MSGPPAVNVTDLIDQRPLGGFQIRTIAICGLIATLDGLDLQAIGLAAPSIITMLQVSPKQFGAVFSAALLGLMLGAFALGSLADRFGRKRVLIASVVIFGVFTLATTLAHSLDELLLVRFLTGLGLGGAMPSFISITAEYSPRRMRAGLVGLLWAGFPLGGVVGGLLASRIIVEFGWQSLFYVGGTLPLVLALALVWALPESIGFLVASGASAEQVRRLVARTCPDFRAAPGARFVLAEEKHDGVGVWQLFTPDRRVGTALVWASYFVVFLMLVTNTAWSPTLLKGAGIDIGQAAIAMAMFNLGSIVGTSSAGFLLSRWGAHFVLPAVFVGSALTIGSVGYGAWSVAAVTVLQGLAGLFLGTGSSGLIVLAAVIYPTAIRSTGVGWAMGVGRFGSFVGPLAVGVLVSRGWQTGSTYAAIGALALSAACFTAMIGHGGPALRSPA